MENDKALRAVVRNMEVAVKDSAENSTADLFKKLVYFIDDLIQNDFNRLLNVLYRVDISEEKLKRKLAEHKESKAPTAEIIANLLIEREKEKIISRERYKDK